MNLLDKFDIIQINRERNLGIGRPVFLHNGVGGDGAGPHATHDDAPADASPDGPRAPSGGDALGAGPR